MLDVNYRVSGELINTDVVMNNTFWIGVQPALSIEALDFTANKIQEFLGLKFK
jgi:CDP-6-deoxy-D-xylo-4-hexulose-3-dehydrase